MSTYDDASLIYYPSGYKAGTAYSLKPTDGSGDLTFTRASTATRVNSDGLIETASVLGSELVVNGDFATDSDWTKGSGWTISGGTANYDGVASIGDIQQSESLVLGKTYKYSFTISNRTQGGVRFFVGNTVGLTHSANGTFTGYITYSSGGYILLQARDSFIGSIDNVSVKEVITLNVPRIDYTGGGCGKLLLEPQRTNLVTYSEDFSNAYWTKSGSSVVSGFVSPSGELNAYTLTEDTSNGQHKIDPQNISVTNGSDYTCSIFAKKGLRDVLQMVWSGAFGSSYVNFDLTNATFQASGSVTGKIETFANGWYKCTITQAATATGLGRCQILLQDNISATRFGSYQGNGSGNVFIAFAQVEEASYPTSYIVSNSGTSTTRLADAASKTGISSLINSAEGVLYAEISALADDLTNRAISLSDGTADNGIQIFYYNVSNRIRCRVYSGGVLQNTINIIGYTITDTHKIALKWESGFMSVFIDGVINGTALAITSTPVGLDRLNLDLGQGSSDFYGNCQSLMVFPTALSDDDLTLLTGTLGETYFQSYALMANYLNYTIQ